MIATMIVMKMAKYPIPLTDKRKIFPETHHER